MRVLKEGDKSQAVCKFCKKLVNITYKDEPLSNADFRKYVKDKTKSTLMGYCDECGNLVVIPGNVD